MACGVKKAREKKDRDRRNGGKKVKKSPMGGTFAFT